MVSILLATTGRPDMAERSVRSLIDTTEGIDLELALAIDADRESADRLTQLDLPDRVRTVLSYSDNYRGMSRSYNDALRISTGDPVVLSSDDMIWQPGALAVALKRLAEFPDGWGMVGLNSGHWGERLATHYVVSRRCVIEVFGGVICWEHYLHSFNDEEACHRARNAGRYAWCEEARIEHEHWIFGTRPKDETDGRALPGWHESNLAYQRRLAEGFPNDFEPVLT